MNEHQQSVALQRFVGATHAALYVHLTNVGGTFSVVEKTKYGFKFFSDWSYLSFEIKDNRLTFNLNTIPEYFEIICGNQLPEPITYLPVNMDGSLVWKLEIENSDEKLFSHDRIARHWYEKFLSHVVEHTSEDDLQSTEAA